MYTNYFLSKALMKVIGFPFVRIFGHFLQFVFLNFSCCTLDARTKNKLSLPNDSRPLCKQTNIYKQSLC